MFNIKWSEIDWAYQREVIWEGAKVLVAWILFGVFASFMFTYAPVTVLIVIGLFSMSAFAYSIGQSVVETKKWKEFEKYDNE